MVLHELHVFQWTARAVDQRHTVARLDRGVRGVWEDAPATAGADDHCFGGDRLNAARHQLDCDYTLYATVINE